MDHQAYSRRDDNEEEFKYDGDTMSDNENQIPLVEEEDKKAEELLIECIRSYPHLYDKTNKDYKDIIKRNNSWVEIAKVVNIQAAECQRRWLRLREKFSREKKLIQEEFKSGQGATNKAPWDLYKHMEFLNPHVLSRKTTSNYKPTKVKVVESTSSSIFSGESSKSSLNNLQQEAEVSLKVAPNCQSGERSFKKRKTVADVDLSLMNMSAAVTQHLNKTDQHRFEDEDDIFSKLISAELKQMPQQEKMEVKGKILKIIYKL